MINDLTPIATSTRADIVEIRIREYLSNKKLKTGDTLPTELELAEALDVSRNVLREALSRLRMLGLIETKKKRGMVLSTPDILGSFERVLNPQLMDDDTMKDIFELRLVLELGMAELLYLRKTDQDIAELEQIVKKDKNANAEEFRISQEIAFHGKLYEITGNTTLKRFQTMLMPIFGFVLSKSHHSIKSEVTHSDLLQILKNGNRDSFSDAMREHLRPHLEFLKER
ncbi:MULTISPECIES: FadR/GntR family transcriptional regulator [Sphingobacterium]|uniref:L-lactate utilization operon repressor n=1 Tax=Sphingobacterium thalpophilum TaxID=259 RepID=A0A4U9VUQ2_9SPHI|nr:MULTISPECIES: FCD domain-containing protein [Sphingobacterium]MCW8313116.1 FCD domain-containing protein [Sphingobacterium sp. InxBP1]VTR51275.1 L-lactate utilization operon repressor [Sphingobacterium thalpophilum]